jgi:hypothetical protein
VVATYETPGPVSALALFEQRAYLATGDTGLLIVDIRNPKAPEEIGRYVTRGPAVGVAISGKLAYVTAGEQGMEVIDVSDPASPRGLGKHGP